MANRLDKPQTTSWFETTSPKTFLFTLVVFGLVFLITIFYNIA